MIKLIDNEGNEVKPMVPTIRSVLLKDSVRVKTEIDGICEIEKNSVDHGFTYTVHNINSKEIVKEFSAFELDEAINYFLDAYDEVKRLDE